MKRVLSMTCVILLLISFCLSPFTASADTDYTFRTNYFEMVFPGTWIIKRSDNNTSFYKEKEGYADGGFIIVLESQLDTSLDSQDQIQQYYKKLVNSLTKKAVDNKVNREDLIIDSHSAIYFDYNPINGTSSKLFGLALVIQKQVISIIYGNSTASNSESESIARSIFNTVHYQVKQADLSTEREMVLAETKTLHEGKYKVGEDLRAGSYTIECTEASEIYSSYKDMMDGLAELSGDMGGILKFYGSLVDKPKVNIRVLGAFGEELSKFELEKGDTKDFSMSDGDILEIEGNKCTCKLTGKVQPGNVSKVSWGMTKDEIVNLMGCKADRESTDQKIGLKMSYSDQPFGDYKGWLTFYLRDNKMYSKIYTWESVDEKLTAGLMSFMNSQYGEPSYDEAEIMAFAQTLYGATIPDDQKAALLVAFRNKEEFGMELHHWKDEDTIVYLLCRQIDSSDSSTDLYFFSLSGMEDEINKARNEIGGLQESVNTLSKEIEETKSEIRFRGIPWGSNYTTVKKEFPGEFIMETSSALYWGGIDTLNELVPWFPEQHISYLSTEKCYSFPSPDFKAGGYTISNIILYFANTPDSNGKITESEKLTSLYGAKYHISTYNLDYDKAAADLKEKLESVYGDVHATYKTSKNIITYPANTDFYIWKGGNDTYAVLVVAKENKDIFLFYLWGEGDTMLKTANEIIKAEKETNATPAPYNTDDTDGL